MADTSSTRAIADPESGATPSLVSVIICTYNRQELFERALRSVCAQSFTDFEVIVVDDGSNPPVEVPDLSAGKVRLLRTEHCGIGAARAAGLDTARGRYTAYCDDDDEWDVEHLNVLVAYLRAHPEVSLVYGDSRWCEDNGWYVPYSRDHEPLELVESNTIFATDVLHQTGDARAAGGFDRSLTVYEDWDLWLRMSQRYILRHVPVVIATHHWHDHAVLASPDWDRWTLVHKRHRGRARERSTDTGSCSSAPTTFDPATWGDHRRELIWHSTLAPNAGFGACARQLLSAVEREGVDIVMAPFGAQPAEGFERFYRPLEHWGRIGFYYSPQRRPSVMRSERLVAYTMWESTAIPPEEIDEINRSVTLLYVPCRQNLEAYGQSGARVPIKVLHHGVDPAHFPFLKRDCGQVFTFGSFGDLTVRKGIDVLLRAFQDEFRREEPARLLLKTSGASPGPITRDPRVMVISEFMEHGGLLGVLRQMDAFVMPSRGEGFGLCGLEAMSTGLPLIATDWGGPAEYLDAELTFPLSYELVPARGAEAHGDTFQGQWAEPSYEHLRYLLRWMYEHPAEARNRGRAASRWVREKWTWEQVARQLVHDLNEVATSTSPEGRRFQQ
jgi:glycosyltransferase involved in cell wall biosynthesis